MTALAPSQGELEQFGVVLERLPIGVIMVDSNRQTVSFVNNAARRAVHPTRLRRGEELPEPWRHFSLRRYAERLVGPGVELEERVALDDGRVFVVSGITARRTNVVVILIEDVSERERRSRAEREFVANAAHELLTPLMGIVGAAHVLQAGAQEVPEDRERFIEHIATECNRLTRIARSLLVLARAQSGEEPPRLEILSLSRLLEDVVGLVNADVSVHCDEDTTALADADLLVQALSNLITNALRHGSGAEIVVEARRVAGNSVEIYVIDRGASGADIAVFRARYRSAAGRDGGGFGLGLSIAQQSIDAIGGHLLLNGGSARVQLAGGGLRDESARPDRGGRGRNR